MLKEIKTIREKKKITDYLSSLTQLGDNKYHYFVENHNPSNTVLYIEHKPYKWVHIRKSFFHSLGLDEHLSTEEMNLLEETIIDYYKLFNYEFKGW